MGTEAHGPLALAAYYIFRLGSVEPVLFGDIAAEAAARDNCGFNAVITFYTDWYARQDFHGNSGGGALAPANPSPTLASGTATGGERGEGVSNPPLETFDFGPNPLITPRMMLMQQLLQKGRATAAAAAVAEELAAANYKQRSCRIIFDCGVAPQG